ncbi:cytochrome P450 (plasmid) [Streptomyces sp. AHU1]|uniref:cytochrome P450 n=1 Tax=Streptomyces sp. AHU1 TaxID=3377215 RepID=UPI003877D178
MENHAPAYQFDPTGRKLHEDNATLQSMGPAARVELPGGIVAWSITRYEMVKQLAEDDRVSRDARQHWPQVGNIPADWPLAPFLISPTVLNAYGSDHRKLRSIMNAAFTSERLDALATGLRRRMGAYLDDLEAAGSEQAVDIRGQYAFPVAAETLCELFGFTRDKWDLGKLAITNLLQPSEDPEEAAAGMGAASGILADLLAEKAKDPGDDMATTLVRSADLTDEERVLALIVTIAGGVPSVTDLISNAVFNLLHHPRQLHSVAEGETPWSEVIEETLRADAPVQHMPLRYALEDLDLGEGVVIRRGEPILMGFGAAGRDEQLHGEDADVFDIHRRNKEHVALGYGVHYCIGAPLGRLEAEIALPALFERFPKLSLARRSEDLDPLPTFIFNGKLQLPVNL